MQKTEKQQSTISKEINSFIFIISSVAIFLGLLFFALRLAIDKYFSISAMVFAVSVVVANVPEV